MAARIMIGILFIGLCALFGRSLAMKSVMDADAVRRFQEEILYLKALTLEKRLPVQEALSHLKEPVFIKMRAFLEKDGHLSLKDAWGQAEKGENLIEDAGQAIEILFGALESLSRDQQWAQYDRAHGDLKRLEDEKRRAGLEKVRLYTSLGAVSGVCIFLFCV